MEDRIKTIEDLSLNAWPSHQIQIYDGWLLRFSYFYTHRTNCVEQIGASAIPLDEKVDYCEEIYRKWGSPVIFKISPLLPPSFDAFLADRGYHQEHRITNMVMDMETDYTPAPRTDFRIDAVPLVAQSWIEALFDLKGTTNVLHRQVVPSMYAAIPKETICVSVRGGERIIGTGLGILDRDYVGVYAIHVASAYRRRHLADTIVRTILSEAQKQGVSHSYLQVVAGNTPAISLYKTLGFSALYDDWFRVKSL